MQVLEVPYGSQATNKHSVCSYNCHISVVWVRALQTDLSHRVHVKLAEKVFYGMILLLVFCQALPQSQALLAISCDSNIKMTEVHCVRGGGEHEPRLTLH